MNTLQLWMMSTCKPTSVKARHPGEKDWKSFHLGFLLPQPVAHFPLLINASQGTNPQNLGCLSNSSYTCFWIFWQPETLPSIAHCPKLLPRMMRRAMKRRMESIRKEGWGGKIHVDKALPGIARPHFLSQTLSRSCPSVKEHTTKWVDEDEDAKCSSPNWKLYESISKRRSCPNTKIYQSKLGKCICQSCKIDFSRMTIKFQMYLSKLINVCLQTYKCICPN